MSIKGTPCYRVSARHAQAPAPDWREQLAARLGARPRRLGLWAELGLYGALQCLGSNVRPTDQAALLVCSQFGPASLLQEALGQVHEGLPLPHTFLQIQPNQLLATLSAQLGWRGDARCVAHPQPLTVLATALAMAQPTNLDVLVGWVDTHPVNTSGWLHLQPVTDPTALADKTWVRDPTHSLGSLLQSVMYVRLDAAGPAVIIEG
ncbi:MAG: hypothetical protein U1E84_09315 [Rhodoferax sp.]